MAAVDFTTLQGLVADVEAKDQALADASTANDAAVAAAAAAAAEAATALSAKNASHDALTTSVAALVAYVNSLTA